MASSPDSVEWSRSQMVVAGFFIALGVLFFVSQLAKFVRFVFSTFVVSGIPLDTFGSRGCWAIVTGASDGIGKQFALQLARAGFNLVLVSRTASKLERLASEIKAAHAELRIETLAMDFSKNHAADFENVAAMVQDKDVAILVNNVGQSHDIPVSYLDTPEEEMMNIITTNCIGTLKITRLVLPGMTARRRGLILTMGSFGGLLPTPLLATYSGSKAFLQNWSSALAAEVEHFGLTVHFVQAYIVTSAMSKVRRSTFLFPTERDFVRSTLAKIGNRCGSVGYAHSGSPWWSHAVFAWTLLTALSPFGRRVLTLNLRTHQDIRARALKKAQRLQLEGKKAS